MGFDPYVGGIENISTVERRLVNIEDAFTEMHWRQQTFDGQLKAAQQAASASYSSNPQAEYLVYHGVTKVGGIPAAPSTTQLGSALVRLWFSDDSGALTDSGKDVLCFNKSTTGAVGGSKPIAMMPHRGGWICMWEEC